MKLKDQDLWNRGLANNQDPYGSGIYQYAERWANLMEKEISDGKSLVEIANRTSHEADTEGITGFTYGAAVSILAAVWECGEELRKWHNLDIQIRDEGEKANESGGVLNPAVLNSRSES
jgi:hypothetical protein